MTDNLRGVIAVLTASTAFVLNDAVVKLISAELASSEILVVRGVLATAMLAVGVLAMGAVRPLALLFTPLMLVRLASAAGATIFIVISLRYLPLATVNTVLQVTPLAVTAGAAIIYGEKVGLPRWLAALTGFFGVVLIVKPGGGFGAAAYLALTTLLFTTIRDLSTRGLHQDIPSIFVAAPARPPSCWRASSSRLRRPWTMPSRWAWGDDDLRGLPVRRQHGHHLALRTGEIAVVAPFRYAPVPLSIPLGYCCGATFPTHRLPWHRPGAGRRALHAAPRAAGPDAQAPPPRRSGAQRSDYEAQPDETEAARGEPAFGCSVMFPSPQIVEMLGFRRLRLGADRLRARQHQPPTWS